MDGHCDDHTVIISHRRCCCCLTEVVIVELSDRTPGQQIPQPTCLPAQESVVAVVSGPG